MILIVNPAAGGGTAVRKLKSVESDIRSRHGEYRAEFTRSAAELRSLVCASFDAGERHFVAAGGDGCVNALATAIMTGLTEAQRRSVALGAIGLGSSNDFHKPLAPDRIIAGIPFKMDFTSIRPRDLVILECERDGVNDGHFFLVNASVGLTAAANRFFNGPGRLLHVMKRMSSAAAILHAAFRTMVMYRNIRITIATDPHGARDASVTNLAILKSPHVSGGLRFPGEASYDSGLMRFYLATDLELGGRFGLFRDLAAGRAPSGTTISTWDSPRGTIRSDRPFDFEFDGEVTSTKCVHLSVLPRHLQVCTC